jgi:hypothetical protein
MGRTREVFGGLEGFIIPVVACGAASSSRARLGSAAQRACWALVLGAGCVLACGCGESSSAERGSGSAASGGGGNDGGGSSGDGGGDGGGGGSSGEGGGGDSGSGSSGDCGHASGGEGGGRGSVQCVDVSHVGPLQQEDLRVIGSGFDADEGLTVRILATLGEPEYGLGQAAIEGGSFDISMPGVLGDYTGLAVHVDRVSDSTCDPDVELIWQLTSGPIGAWGSQFSVAASGEVVWEITPDTLMTFDQVGPCDLNGIFDLAIYLPCPAV